jgi:hypothetical protein
MQFVVLPLEISLAFTGPLMWYFMIFHDICTTAVNYFQPEAAKPRQSVLDIEHELL